MNTKKNDFRLKTARGFSLLEMIAVLAIMSILASSMAPNVIASIDRAMNDAERSNLDTMADSLVTYIERTKSIPSARPSDWSAAIAAYGDETQGQILQNKKRYRRVLYVDPAFFSKSGGRFKGYQQDTGLSAQPASPRMMLVSVMSGNAPSAPTSSKAFDDIWNQTDNAGLKESDDVIIKRINLARQFHRVTLTNRNTSQAGYRIENGNQAPIPAASNGGEGSVTRYVLSNSQIKLYDQTFPSGSLLATLTVNDETFYQLGGSAGSGSGGGAGGNQSDGGSGNAAGNGNNGNKGEDSGDRKKKKDKKKKDKKKKDKKKKKDRDED